MRILPFMDIPVVDVPTPSIELMKSDLEKWAEGDMIRLSVAYLAYGNDGNDPEDYYFPIGFISDGNLVTTKEIIEQIGDSLYFKVGWPEFNLLLPKLRNHLALYLEKINIIPDWGTPKYYKLLAEGRTPRWLEGPHKVGRLKSGQRRKVILDYNGDIIYGPRIQGY